MLTCFLSAVFFTKPTPAEQPYCTKILEYSRLICKGYLRPVSANVKHYQLMSVNDHFLECRAKLLEFVGTIFSFNLVFPLVQFLIYTFRSARDSCLGAITGNPYTASSYNAEK